MIQREKQQQNKLRNQANITKYAKKKHYESYNPFIEKLINHTSNEYSSNQT